MILSITMILSGLIYEQIVFIPNFFNRNGIEPKELFSKFHVNTNPVHYHLIPTTILLITLIISWTNQLIEKHLLKSILISVLILISLTGYVVYFINDKLYFKTPLEEGDSIMIKNNDNLRNELIIKNYELVFNNYNLDKVNNLRKELINEK